MPIDALYLKSLIELRFGSVDAMAVEWEDRVTRGAKKSGKSRDRGSVYRWLKKGIPSREEELFGICAVLDIDPVCVLPLTSNFMRYNFTRERIRIQINPTRKSNLKPYDAILMPGVDWPNDSVILLYYGRPWFQRIFEHDPKKISGVYGLISLETCSDQTPPFAFHFAYRRTHSIDRMWRPYGTVIRYVNRMVLISESGDFQSLSVADISLPNLVETFFGEGPAIFKIACLHKFESRISAPSDAAKAVRFKA